MPRPAARQPVSLRADVLTYEDYATFGTTRYALAWSLVHMLIEKRRPGSDKPIYRDRFVRYFDAVAGGADALVAFEEHVGPARAIEEEWKAYLRELPLPPLEEGIARLGEGQHDEAIRLFEQHRREHPKDAKGAYWLGEALVAARRLDAAVEAYRAAIELEPQHADASSSLAWTLMLLERSAEAVDAARRAVALRPSGEHQYLLAMAAVRAGQKEVALTAVREAMKLLGPLRQLRELEALARGL